MRDWNSRSLIALLIFALLLVACGPEPTPTQDISIVYTQAAETVIADMTLAAPSATEPPPPPTETPLPLPTNTPLPTQTFPPTPTATLSPEDPAVVLGDPDWVDSFNTDSNWTLFDVECFKSEIVDGKYVMTGKGANYVCWELTWPVIQNFYLEVTIETTQVCPANNAFGMLFRSPSNSQGYVYGISCDGRYALWSWDGEEGNFLVQFTPSAQLAAGPNQVNRIGVMTRGDQYGLYINGVLQLEVRDSKFLEQGKIGLAVLALTDNPVTVRFDNLRYWELE